MTKTSPIDQLLDRFAIQDLITDFAERIDAGDIDGAAALFGEGSITYYARGALLLSVSGSEGVRQLLTGGRMYGDGTPRLRNVLTNMKVVVDDDRAGATARSYITVLQATDELPLQPIAAGTFTDRFRRDRDRWCFSERVGELHLVGDMSAHMDVAMLDTEGSNEP